MSLARTGFKRGTKLPWWGDRGEFRTIAGSRGDLNGGVTAGLFPNRMERARGDGLAAALGRWPALMSGERATVLLDLARAQPVSHHSPRLGREGVCMFGGGAPELVAAAPAAPAPRCGRAVLMMCVTAAQQWELPMQKPGRDQCKLLFCMFRQHSKNSAPRAYKFWVPNCNGADARRPEWRI